MRTSRIVNFVHDDIKDILESTTPGDGYRRLQTRKAKMLHTKVPGLL